MPKPGASAASGLLGLGALVLTRQPTKSINKEATTMTTMTEAAYRREQAAKKKKAAAAKKKPMGSCARVREIADRNPKARPEVVYAKCEAAGIHPRTTRTEYANWCKDKFGKTPSERFGKSGKSGTGAKKKTPKGKTTAQLRAA